MAPPNFRRTAAQGGPAPLSTKPSPRWPVDPGLGRRIVEAQRDIEHTRRLRSTSNATPGSGMRSSAGSRRIASLRTSRSRPQPGAGAPAPEWMSREWKLQVEAEARGRLKKDISGAGQDR